MNRGWSASLILLAFGCGDAGVVSAPEAPPPYDLGPPLLEISSVDVPDGPLEFFRIVSAELADDGSLILADGGLFSIIVVPQDGDPFAIELRKGEGPGEGQAVSKSGSMGGDTIYWVDPILQRVSFLRTSTEEYLDLLAVPLDPERGLPEVKGSLNDSTLLFLQWKAPAFTGSAEVARGPAKIYCSTVEGRRSMDVEVEHSEVLVIREGAGTSSNRIPYAAGPVLATWKNRILYSDTRNLDVQVIGCGGEPVREFSLPEAANLGKDRTRETLDAWLAEASDALANRMGRIFDEYESAVTGPGATHGRILTDPLAGRLWIESVAGDLWIVTDSTGQEWGPVRIPEGRRPLAVNGDRVVLLAVDSLGVHRVEVRELEGSIGG